MWVLNRISVGTAMIALSGAGFLAAYIFAGLTISAQYLDRTNIAEDKLRSELGIAIGHLTHEIQKERGASAGYLSSGGTRFEERLGDQRTATNVVRDAFLSRAAALRDVGQDKAFEDGLTEVEGLLAGLDGLRTRVDGLDTELLTAVGELTHINRSAIGLLPEIGKRITHAPTARAIQRHSILMSAKDLAGLERATGATGFTLAASGDGVFPAPVLTRFTDLILTQNVLFSMYSQIASAGMAAALESATAGPAASRVADMRKAAISGDRAQVGTVDAEVWFDAITEKIDLLKGAEDQGAAEISGLVSGAYAEATQLLMSSVALISALSIVVGGGAVVMVRSVRRSLARTRATLNRFAAGDFETPVDVCPQPDLAQVSQSLVEFREKEITRQRAAKLNDDLQSSSQDGIERTLRYVERGDFSSRVRLRDLSGPALILGQGLNDILKLTEKVFTEQRARDQQNLAAERAATAQQEAAVQEISDVVEACARGDFSMRLSLHGRTGIWADVANGINSIAEMSDRGLAEISRVIGAIARGELSLRMDGEFRGRFEEIAGSVNSAIDILSDLISDIDTETHHLSRASSEMETGAGQLRKRSEAQLETVARSSGLAASLAEGAATATEKMNEGDVLLGQLQQSSVQTEEAAEAAVHSIADVETGSSEMQKIVATIDEIAFQTNLLALNASVEAARAGEAGKGFLVVANEVRSLAGRCAEASQQIGDLIANNVKTVRRGSAQVRDTGAQIKELRESLEEVQALIAAATDASHQQAEASVELSAAIGNLEETARQNVSLAQSNNTLMAELKDSETRLATGMSSFSGSVPAAEPSTAALLQNSSAA